MFTWEGPPSPFLHLPVLFLDDNDAIMDSFLSINNINAPPAAPTTLLAHGVDDDHVATTTNAKTRTHVAIKKKVGKKDRHSKIRTAQGLRDRRMRLSLKVARSFFDLQDMLGFEKASKTVEWLLDISKVAIHRLASDKNMVSSSLSASSESEVEYEAAAMEVHETTEESLEDKPRKEKRKRRKTCKAAISVNPLAREVRDKARARARERTREKMMARSRIESNPKISRHFLRDCHDSVDHFISQEHQASLGMIEQLLGISSPSSSSAFSYNSHDLAGANHNHEFQGFLANDQPIIEPTASCYAMTSTRPELSKLLNPSSIFMNITNGEQWSPSSIMMTEPFS